MDFKKNIVFFGAGYYGHTMPTLKLIKALVQDGHKVIYCNVKKYQSIIEASGTKFLEFPPEVVFSEENIIDTFSDVKEYSLTNSIRTMPWALELFKDHPNISTGK